MCSIKQNMFERLILTILLFASIRGQSTVCRTTVGDTGNCMPLKQCTPLKNLSDKRVKTQEDIQLLRASSCGLTPDGRPKVCCPSDWDAWTTPRSTPTTEPPIITHMVTPLTHTKPTEAQPEPIVTWTGSNDCPPTADLPSEECCGRDAVGGNRIFGGNETSIDEYPWLALVEYHRELVRGEKVEKLVQTLCGGTLISSRFVLTAAHCIKISWGKPTNIRLSEYDTSSTTDCVTTDGGGEECISAYIAPIQRSIIHPEYSPLENNKRNDIALFLLQSDVPYSDFIKPICLPSQDASHFTSDTKFYVAGWGFDGEAYSNIKLDVDVPYVPMQQCQPQYITSKKKIVLTNRHLCAGGEEGKDSCIGDSGGPLMYQTSDLKFELVGIVSFGPRDCGKKGYPAVYTNVYQYIDWIKKNMRI